jgi:integrase
MPKLTKKYVESLDLPSAGQKLVWDTEVKGFGVRLTPTGMTYIAQGRVNGKSRRVTIGKHGPFTVQDARDDAKERLRDMSRGINPVAEKKRSKALKVTLKTVSEAYINDHKLKESSLADIRKHVNGSFANWKDKPIINISRDAVLSRFRELSERSRAQTNQAFRILRALLNYARATYRPDDVPILLENPVQVLSDAKLWHNIQPKNRRIPTDKVGMVWNMLRKFSDDQLATPNFRALSDVLAFALVTGGRWGEVSTLTWDRVDLKDNNWYLPDPKNRNSVTFPLSKQAKEIINQRPKINEFVFANKKSKTGHVVDQRPVMTRLSAECDTSISAHDLRRTFRAIAGECGIEFWKTKLLMNHKLSGDITISAYTETSDLRYLAHEAQEIGAWIERQAAIAASEKVVQLTQGQAEVA